MSRFAVIGMPVKHSKSPAIHTQFAQQFNMPMDYEAIAVEQDDLAHFVHGFFAAGGKGLNVTLPHKEDAFSLCEAVSVRAAQAKATNTLYLDQNGNLSGDNTDGLGLVADIEGNHGFEIAQKRVLVLGAGGAVRGVLGPLIERRPSRLVVANRTRAKAERLQGDFAELMNFDVADYDQLNSAFDLVINGTSMSVSGRLPPLPVEVLAPGACCYDMMYADSDTPFVGWGKLHGAHLALDGLGMLVEQAAESFAIWHGKRPGTDAVLAQLGAQRSLG